MEVLKETREVVEARPVRDRSEVPGLPMALGELFKSLGALTNTHLQNIFKEDLGMILHSCNLST